MSHKMEISFGCSTLHEKGKSTRGISLTLGVFVDGTMDKMPDSDEVYKMTEMLLEIIEASWDDGVFQDFSHNENLLNLIEEKVKAARD